MNGVVFENWKQSNTLALWNKNGLAPGQECLQNFRMRVSISYRKQMGLFEERFAIHWHPESPRKNVSALKLLRHPWPVSFSIRFFKALKCYEKLHPRISERWPDMGLEQFDRKALYAKTICGIRRKNPSFGFSLSIFSKAHSTAKRISSKSTGFIAW